jgi:4-diphosphocytidyl-2-C-methyl-D-erythritol kinase
MNVIASAWCSISGWSEWGYPMSHATAATPVSLSLEAPAKLNLFLHVLGQRQDGYHELESVFQLIDLADSVRVTPIDGAQILRPLGALGVPAEADLVVRAALLLKKYAKAPSLGASIEVIKRIPQGAGLGGGSSDAASTLILLNRLWGLGFSLDTLAVLGSELGADVAFFVRGQSAFVTGKGERTRPIETPKLLFLVLYPGVASSTREVFQSPELTRNSRKLTIGGSLTWDPESGFIGRNDLETAAITLKPAIGAALATLNRFAPARMTGSGSCVFAAFDDPKKAQAARQAVLRDAPLAWQGWVVRSIDRIAR